MTKATKCLVDCQFTINLIFIKLYVVFTLGKDRRGNSQPVKTDRRKQSSLITLVISLITFTWFLIAGTLIALIVVYLIKQSMNINIFDNLHPLSDSLRALGICH